MKKEKAIRYRTEKNALKKDFIKAWLLVPLFGLGLKKLKALNKQLDDSEVLVYDDKIVAKNGTITISELSGVRLVPTDELKKNGLNSVEFTSKDLVITLFGIPESDAQLLEDTFLLAIRHEAERKKLQERSKGDYADEFHIGGLEHMNSLVGLWQQGLISDEDFFTEQKKFKKE